MGGWIYFSRKMSLKYQTPCPLWLLLSHCYWFFISPVRFPFSGLFLLPSSHRAHRFFLWFCIMPLSSPGLHNTFLLCCVSKPQTKVILIWTIQLNLALLKVFSLIQWKWDILTFLQDSCKCHQELPFSNCTWKKKEYGIMTKIVRDQGERRHGW